MESSPEMLSSVRSKWLEYIRYSSSKLCQPGFSPPLTILICTLGHLAAAFSASSELVPKAEQTTAFTSALLKRYSKSFSTS